MLLKFARGLLMAVLVIYTIPLVAWLLLRWLVVERWPMVGLLNAVGIWWFVPLLILVPVALVLRARQASGMALVLLLPAIGLFGPDFVPHVGGVAEDAPRVRVLTFNTLVSNQSFDEVAALVQAQQPDVVAIQELSPEMAEGLSARLGEAYPYRLLYPWTDPRGIGLWSRLPLSEGPSLHHPYWERWAHSALLDLNGQPLYLVNVHLWPIGTLDQRAFARGLVAQHAQAVALRDFVASLTAPVIVAGDFNASPTNASYAIVDEVLDDAWREAGVGAGFTFPAPGAVHRYARPFLRIDYLWAGPGVQPVAIEVLPAAGSDHLPVIGDFVLPPP